MRGSLGVTTLAGGSLPSFVSLGVVSSYVLVNQRYREATHKLFALGKLELPQGAQIKSVLGVPAMSMVQMMFRK